VSAARWKPARSTRIRSGLGARLTCCQSASRRHSMAPNSADQACIRSPCAPDGASRVWRDSERAFTDPPRAEMRVPARWAELSSTDTSAERSWSPSPSTTPFHCRAACEIHESRSLLAATTSRGAGRCRRPVSSRDRGSANRTASSEAPKRDARSSRAAETCRERCRMSSSASADGRSRNERQSALRRRNWRSRPRRPASNSYPSPALIISLRHPREA